MIKIRNLHKAFSATVRPLQGVDIDVTDKKTIVLIGKSGTGKSVLLKSIVGLIEPDRGSIIVDDTEVVGTNQETLQRIRHDVGYIFQGGALYDSLTVGQNLAFPLEKTRNLSKKEIKEKIEYYLEEVGLPEKINQMPSELSGGQRKRIGVARTIITEPKYLLYDEPTTGLDPLTTEDISHLILQLRDRLGITSIAVTHDPYCMSIIADTVAYIDEGVIKFQGTIAEAKEVDDPFLHSFFHASTV
ncbi:MAG: ATP-binding cassette domain-containing protein [Ignavibacteriae bacterium]|nr:ATP-binding cassette domain-containing protein [Ignavibacteriota bacterium]MCB9216091.1 ATP-binding cassette domain-containing protein [Ignavibacteria bacterium]